MKAYAIRKDNCWLKFNSRWCEYDWTEDLLKVTLFDKQAANVQVGKFGGEVITVTFEV